MQGAGWSFQKFNRRAQDWAIVGVAAWRRNGDAGVGLVNMGSTPILATSVVDGARRRRVGRRRRRAGRRRGRPAGRPQRQRRVPHAPREGPHPPRPRGRQLLTDATRRDFAGGDQAYLRDVQYGATTNLDARSRLHARWSTAPEPWPTWLPRRISWPVGGTVVEVGCGTGSMWAAAADEWPPGRYVLTDQSAAMVGTAVARSGPRLTSAVGVVADAQSVPVPDRVADVVVANHMLYHVPDIARAIAELAHVLAPDGVALVSTNGGDHMRELTAILVATFGHGLPEEVSRFGRETGGDLLRASFADVEWHPFADGLACTDPADVLAYMTSFPPGEGATPAQRASLQAGIDAAFTAGAGTFRITKDAGTFVARRPRG